MRPTPTAVLLACCSHRGLSYMMREGGGGGRGGRGGDKTRPNIRGCGRKRRWGGGAIKEEGAPTRTTIVPFRSIGLLINNPSNNYIV